MDITVSWYVRIEEAASDPKYLAILMHENFIFDCEIFAQSINNMEMTVLQSAQICLIFDNSDICLCNVHHNLLKIFEYLLSVTFKWIRFFSIIYF